MNKTYINGLAENSVTFVIKSLLQWDDELPLDLTFAEVDDKGLGCDGLDCVEIIMAIEYVLNITIDESLFFDIEGENQQLKSSLTIKNVVDYCADKVLEALNL